MKIAIVGSRSFTDYGLFRTNLLKTIKNNNIPITKIISGGASGVDSLAEKFANDFKIPIEIIKPDWNGGKYAGLERNTTIVDKCDVLIAFWDGVSGGTKDSIKKAKRKNKKTYIIEVNELLTSEGGEIE